MHAQTQRPADGATPLPPQLRASFERAAGTDLSDVRLHHDARLAGAGLAGSTTGSDISLDTSRRRPEAADGRWLAAHELAHVVQQRGGTGGPRLGPAGLEAQADRAATAVSHGARVPSLSRAPVGAQHKVELRDVGRGEQSGFDRVPELVDRLNAMAPNVLFEFDGTLLTATPVEGSTLTEFERQMVDYCGDGTPSVPLRLTNRHGLLGDRVNGFHEGVFVDAWSSGYVDIDDLLASDDLGLQSALVHFIRERQTTRNYAHRIGSESVDLSPGSTHQAEFDRAHGQGLDAEQDLLRGFFGDPSIHFIDRDNRIYRNDRRDTIRVHVRQGHGADSGIQAISIEIVLHGTGKVISAEDYQQLLEQERSTAAAAVSP